MVNPAILGDEYIYSMNARKVGLWDASPEGDFSNYLFNMVYQSTNLCGTSFYTCAKILNIFFFLGFIFILFLVAIRFLPFYLAFIFMIASSLSPLSVYTSMFLPESMYMFFIGLILVAVLRAVDNFKWLNWLLVGISIGLASLVKPHAWLSAIAVGITFIVVNAGKRNQVRGTFIYSFIALVGGAIASRVLVGFAIAGPKALGFFGQYFGFSTLQQVVTSPIQQGDDDTGQDPIAGVSSLFGPQFAIHITVAIALLAISIVALLVAIFEIIKSRKLEPVTGFALFAFIWLFTMIIEIVAFTGWVTGSGDDHTSRVLLRYYEFLFLIVPLAAMAVWSRGLGAKVGPLLRWATSAVLVLLITPAFTGFFSNLTIQIADAPTLAGLVVNLDVFNAVAIVGVLSLLVFATFPKYVIWTYFAVLPSTMIGTGWQIQDQYQVFRGSTSAADLAGQFLAENFSSQDIRDTYVIANSRFDATNVAIWADNPDIEYELYGPGSVIPVDRLPAESRYVISIGDISLEDTALDTVKGDGFTLYILDPSQ